MNLKNFPLYLEHDIDTQGYRRIYDKYLAKKENDKLCALIPGGREITPYSTELLWGEVSTASENLLKLTYNLVIRSRVPWAGLHIARKYWDRFTNIYLLNKADIDEYLQRLNSSTSMRILCVGDSRASLFTAMYNIAFIVQFLKEKQHFSEDIMKFSLDFFEIMSALPDSAMTNDGEKIYMAIKIAGKKVISGNKDDMHVVMISMMALSSNGANVGYPELVTVGSTKNDRNYLSVFSKFSKIKSIYELCDKYHAIYGDGENQLESSGIFESVVGILLGSGAGYDLMVNKNTIERAVRANYCSLQLHESDEYAQRGDDESYFIAIITQILCDALYEYRENEASRAKSAGPVNVKVIQQSSENSEARIRELTEQINELQQQLRTKNIAISRKDEKIKQLEKKISKTEKVPQGDDEKLKTYEQTIKYLTEQNELLSKQKKSTGASAENTVSFNFTESENYPGEIRDYLITILTDIGNNFVGRKEHILQDIIKNNDKPETLKHNRDRLRKIFDTYRDHPSQFISDMNSLGFIVTQDGKHYKCVYHNDDRYTYSVSKTPSDYRTSDNTVSKIALDLF